MVEGSDKRSIEGKHDFLGNPIALVLEVLDLPLIRDKVGHVGKRLFEQASRTHNRRCLLFEQIVEATLSGDKRQRSNVLARILRSRRPERDEVDELRCG